MGITRTTNKHNSTDQLSCHRCNALLPPRTNFCGICGERLASKVQHAFDGQTYTKNISLNNHANSSAIPIKDNNQNVSSLMPIVTNSTRDQEAREIDEGTNEDTVRIAGLSQEHHNRWRLSGSQTHELDSQEAQTKSVLHSESDSMLHRTTEEHSKARAIDFSSLKNRSLWLFACSLVQRVRSNSLIRNGIFIMGTGVATAGFGYIYWILAAHAYTAYDVGLASALFSSQFAIVEQQAGYAFVLLVGVPIMTLSTLLDQAFVGERRCGFVLWVRECAFWVGLATTPFTWSMRWPGPTAYQ